MTESLLDRIDRHLISLLDEAKPRDCGDAAKGATQGDSEEGPGVSFAERVSLLNVATRYLQVRNGIAADKPVEPAPEAEPEEPPEIDGFVTRLRPNRTARRRGRT